MLLRFGSVFCCVCVGDVSVSVVSVKRRRGVCLGKFDMVF